VLTGERNAQTDLRWLLRTLRQKLKAPSDLESARYHSHSLLSQSCEVSRKAASSAWSRSSARSGTAASASAQPCRALCRTGRITSASRSADTSTSSPSGHCFKSDGSIGTKQVPEMEIVFARMTGECTRDYANASCSSVVEQCVSPVSRMILEHGGQSTGEQAGSAVPLQDPRQCPDAPILNFLESF